MKTSILKNFKKIMNRNKLLYSKCTPNIRHLEFFLAVKSCFQTKRNLPSPSIWWYKNKSTYLNHPTVHWRGKGENPAKVPETLLSKQRRHLRSFVEFTHTIFWFIISLVNTPSVAINNKGVYSRKFVEEDDELINLLFHFLLYLFFELDQLSYRVYR